MNLLLEISVASFAAHLDDLAFAVALLGGGYILLRIGLAMWREKAQMEFVHWTSGCYATDSRFAGWRDIGRTLIAGGRPDAVDSRVG